MSDLVIVSWRVSNQNDPKVPLVQIRARRPGVVAWMLRLIGIDPTVTFQVQNNVFSYSAASWSGWVSVSVPIRNIESTSSGLYRPWNSALGLGIIVGAILNIILPFFPFLAFGGSLVTYALSIILGALAGVIYYALNKSLSLYVSTPSGQKFGFTFRRSVIEGQAIDDKAAQHVAAIINYVGEMVRSTTVARQQVA